MLLLLLPQTGMGALPCMVGATFLAVGVAILAERRRTRRLGLEAAGAGRGGDAAPKTPMSPVAAAGLTLLVVLVVVYVIFVAANG